FFFFSSRRRHTRLVSDWSSDVCSSDLAVFLAAAACAACAQELTVQSIYGTSGLTGRAPDTIQWSPDGKKVSYFLHQEQGDRADRSEERRVGKGGRCRWSRWDRTQKGE